MLLLIFFDHDPQQKKPKKLIMSFSQVHLSLTDSVVTKNRASVFSLLFKGMCVH